MFTDLLLPMFDDEYYPDILVAEVKQLIKKLPKVIYLQQMFITLLMQQSLNLII
jgi:hypothetical protein